VHYLKWFFVLFCVIFINNVRADAILTDIHGEKFSFSSLRGKWVMINYWASWCQPCVDEIRELNYFYKKHKNHVALYAVNFDELPVENQLELIEELGIRYPSLRENPGAQLGLDHVRGVPATFVFDPKGKLHDTLYGAQTQDSLNKAIS
jgi:thiol-disulfide isomerase/thioredoxin